MEKEQVNDKSFTCSTHHYTANKIRTYFLLYNYQNIIYLIFILSISNCQNQNFLAHQFLGLMKETLYINNYFNNIY